MALRKRNFCWFTVHNHAGGDANKSRK